MIRVELGEEVKWHGRFRWTCPRYALSGISRQPLLDACREIQRDRRRHRRACRPIQGGEVGAGCDVQRWMGCGSYRR